MTKNIIIFQAPYASLHDCGFLLEMHKDDSQAPVPAQYYSPVFAGPVEVPSGLGTDAVLECIHSMFNRDDRPNGKTMRSLSVGDVVRMDGKNYLDLAGKYGIHGKAATLLHNIFKYMSEQGMDFEEEQEYLEAMLEGLGISTEDRELLHVLTALQDVLDYIEFEAGTTESWPFAVSDDEILTDKERLLKVAARLAEMDNLGDQYSSDAVYEELLEEFGEAPAEKDGEDE